MYFILDLAANSPNSVIVVLTLVLLRFLLWEVRVKILLPPSYMGLGK